MNKEYFKILKEIQSLANKIDSLESTIAKEQKRIEFVNGQRDARIEQIQEFETKKQELEQLFEKIELDTNLNIKKIEELNSNLMNIVSEKEQLALESEILGLRETQLKSDSELEQHIDNFDFYETELNECKEFIEGSKNSISELKAEIDHECDSHNQEITKLNGRITLLMDEIPDQFKNAYIKVSKRKLKYGAFTSINQKSCNICGLQADNVTISIIEDKYTLKFCAGCGRIFIPTQTIF